MWMAEWGVSLCLIVLLECAVRKKELCYENVVCCEELQLQILYTPIQPCMYHVQELLMGYTTHPKREATYTVGVCSLLYIYQAWSCMVHDRHVLLYSPVPKPNFFPTCCLVSLALVLRQLRVNQSSYLHVWSGWQCMRHCIIPWFNPLNLYARNFVCTEFCMHMHRLTLTQCNI